MIDTLLLAQDSIAHVSYFAQAVDIPPIGEKTVLIVRKVTFFLLILLLLGIAFGLVIPKKRGHQQGTVGDYNYRTIIGTLVGTYLLWDINRIASGAGHIISVLEDIGTWAQNYIGST